MFGIGYIPHNVIIGGDGEVLYSDTGYNQAAIIAIIEQALENLPSDLDEDGFDEDVDNCPENYNPTQADIDSDGFGDACDVCDNENVFVTGNVNGDIDMNNEPIINFFDVVALLDHLQLSQSTPQAISECEAQSGNINIWSVESGSKLGCIETHGKFVMAVRYVRRGLSVGCAHASLAACSFRCGVRWCGAEP